MLFNEAEIKSIDNIKNIEGTLNNSYKIIIPNLVTNKNQKEVYKALKKNLDKYKGSIYYSREEEENKNGKAIDKEVKYIYFNNLDYFNKLSLSEGRSFKIGENESDLFLSTDKTEKSNEIGRIASINKDDIVEVRTLSKLVDSGFLDGYCYVQLQQKSDINKFINDLEKNLNVKGVNVVENNNSEEYDFSYEWIVVLVLYFFCMLIIVYDILKSYKNIAIKKMLGISKLSIYISYLKRLVLIQVLAQAIVTAILCFIKFESYNKYVGLFLKNLMGVYFIELILLICFVSLPFIYINKIKISDMIKNKQPTKEIIVFNTIVKIVIIVCFFVISKFIIQDFNSFKNIYSKSFKKWDQMNDYVVLPNLTVTTAELMKYLASEKSSNDQKQIYTYFDKKGAIFADFSEFTPMVRNMRLKETKYPYESDNVWVNENYLKLNPIYDIKGNAVKVSEKQESEIILVPEKYKKYENAIIAKHKFWNRGYRDIFAKNRQIKIIWIKNGQSIFSYNLDVNTYNGNCVTDAFVNIMTENNGGMWDYNRVFCYTGNPFKIKIDPNLSFDESIRPELKKYGYSQYIPTISKVNEMVAADSDNVKQKMYLYLGIASIVGISLILIIIQSVFNFFNQYKQYLAIRHLHGYGIFEKYKNYFALIVISWFILSAGLYAFGIVDLHSQIKLSLVLILFELILSIIALIFKDKKNITSVIKGS
jgi:putative ABC transport system permease protein